MDPVDHEDEFHDCQWRRDPLVVALAALIARNKHEYGKGVFTARAEGAIAGARQALAVVLGYHPSQADAADEVAACWLRHHFATSDEPPDFNDVEALGRIAAPGVESTWVRVPTDWLYAQDGQTFLVGPDSQVALGVSVRGTDPQS